MHKIVGRWIQKRESETKVVGCLRQGLREFCRHPVHLCRYDTENAGQIEFDSVQDVLCEELVESTECILERMT